MNIILFVIILVVIFFLIQKNNRFPINGFPLLSSPRGDDALFPKKLKEIINPKTTEEKRTEFKNTLKTISSSDKVVLSEVVDKWSLNKNVIDSYTNKRSVEILKDVMGTLGDTFSGDKFYVKNIENVYVMKDKKNNFRTIISAFIYDIKNYHTVKIIVDVVYFENNMYINHVDIDESGIKNVLQHYDFKYNSSGILNKYNNFNKNVEELIDTYYKDKYKVIPLKHNEMVDLSGTFSFTGLKEKLLPKEKPETNIFCDKEKLTWGKFGIQDRGDENCVFNNPSIRDYPESPTNNPNNIVNNVDINNGSWLWDPDRGHTV